MINNAIKIAIKDKNTIFVLSDTLNKIKPKHARSKYKQCRPSISSDNEEDDLMFSFDSSSGEEDYIQDHWAYGSLPKNSTQPISVNGIISNNLNNHN